MTVEGILDELIPSTKAVVMIMLASATVIAGGPLLMLFGLPMRPALGVSAVVTLVILGIGLVDPWKKPSSEVR